VATAIRINQYINPTQHAAEAFEGARAGDDFLRDNPILRKMRAGISGFYRDSISW